MSIQKLYFGKDDAETDFTSSGLLRDSFLQTVVYNQIKSGNKTLVIGRKGSGKSAICLMLNRQLCHDACSCIVTPDAISADEIRRFEMIGVNEQQSKKLVWRYIFLTQICKFLVGIARKKYESDFNWPPEIKKVRQFLVDNREVDDLSFQEKFWRILNRINATLTFGAFGQSLELSTEDMPNSGLQLGVQLDFLENLLISQLEQLRDYRLYILVDKVDEIWSDDPSSCHMAVGLLMAAKDINVKFENVRCIVFLRSDIYQQLQFFDKDKLRGDEEAILWTQSTLPELILARARISTGNLNMTSSVLWSSYFPAYIDQLPTSEFILSHTLMRPRDVIQLCNLCADLARREDYQTIGEKHVLQALNVYSSWKLNDLIGEYHVNYPYLNDLLILFSNTSFVIPRRRLEIMYSRAETVLKERYPSYAASLTIDSILNILYGIGFIGLERGRHTFYYYETPGTVEDWDTIFVIHPAFRYALKSISSVDMQPYQAGSEIRFQQRIRSEMLRRRSAGRGELERPISAYKEVSHLIYRIESLRVLLAGEEGVPSDVVGEISRNVSAIISEFQNTMDSKMPDIVQLQITVFRTCQYLADLNTKLEENGYLLSKSRLRYRIQELVSDTEQMRDSLQHF